MMTLLVNPYPSSVIVVRRNRSIIRLAGAVENKSVKDDISSAVVEIEWITRLIECN